MAEETTHLRVLVTGAYGLLGRHVVRALVDEGHTVRAASRDPAREAAAAETRSAEDEIEACHLDVTDTESVTKAVDGVDAVVHLVGVIRERGAYTFDAVNRVGTANVVDAAREAGVRVFVHVSALGVSDSPDFPYLLSKWRGEQAVINGGVPYTILRSSTYFGPGDRFIGTLAALVKAFPIIPVPGNGRTLYQPLHVEDMARCVASALKLPEPRGQTVDLGGPRHLTHDQILDTIARTYHLKRLKFHVPLALMRMMVAIMERLAPSPPATLHQLRMLSVDSVTELDSVERIFGFQPRPLDGAIDYIRDMSYWEALKLSLGFSRRRGPPSRKPEP